MESSRADTTRERIVAAVSRLLAEGGREAVSTRAVSAAAGVQAPAIYRLFGDKQGLLDAVASHGIAGYLAGKAHREPGPDPVGDLRRAFDEHVEFGLANPAVYALMAADPRPGTRSPADAAGIEVLAKLVSRIAEAGRLQVPEQLATQLITSAGRGITLTLIAQPADERDPALIHAAPRGGRGRDHHRHAGRRQPRPGRRRRHPARRPATEHDADARRGRPAHRVARPHRHRNPVGHVPAARYSVIVTQQQDAQLGEGETIRAR